MTTKPSILLHLMYVGEIPGEQPGSGIPRFECTWTNTIGLPIYFLTSRTNYICRAHFASIGFKDIGCWDDFGDFNPEEKND